MLRYTLFLISIVGLFFLSFTSPIHQIFNTSLQITVRNELGNAVEGAEVILYKTEQDYENNTNPVIEPQHTNEKGVVSIKKLEATEYYVNVSKDDANNFGAGVQTGKLEPKKINKVTIIIE